MPACPARPRTQPARSSRPATASCSGIRSPGHTAAGRASLDGGRADRRARTCQAANYPQPCPSRAPHRRRDRPPSLYDLCIAAACGNTRTCRDE
jgi:hypothetical protein